MNEYNIQSDLKKIISKYLDGKASEEEKAFLERYYVFFDKEDDVLNKLTETEVQAIEDKIQIQVFSAIAEKKTRFKIFNLIPYKQIAAAVLLVAGGYIAYQTFWHNGNIGKAGTELTQLNPIDSAENAVLLTLSNGKKLKLEEIQSGVVVEESGAKIEKASDGTITYTVNDNLFSPSAENKYHTISTPNGKLSQVNLPDGTKVWLNAMSSLKYPVAFNSQQRIVELSGEAYFEVTKNKAKPFIVKAKNTEVQVLGTKFNVNAYANDDFTKTTLTEGLVSVTNDKLSKLLKPGQQATTFGSKAKIDISSVDIEEAMAWKNGYFMFNNLDIKTVMNMISRWYDIEVEYQGKIENEVFIGTVSRFENIEKLLSTIELTGGVHFKIEESNKKRRKVVVMP